MNRKIYFKDKFIEVSTVPFQDPDNQAFKYYDDVSTESKIKQVISELIDDNEKRSARVTTQSFDLFLKDLKEHLYYIEAAGGFIEKDRQFLCIHRLGRWDLPKGKLEKNETIEEAAVRECEEECGIKKLTIIRPLRSTFHIYQYKKGYAIKQSYWFYMHSTFDKKLKAQEEENIDEVRWFSQEEIETVVLKDTYYTVNDVIKEGLAASLRLRQEKGEV
jgi:8-oxo-dGTP pyrophosphatase MutT (NUDIX family)